MRVRVRVRVRVRLGARARARVRVTGHRAVGEHEARVGLAFSDGGPGGT